MIRIDLLEGCSNAEIKSIMNTVQGCVVEAFNVPVKDRYQIMAEHKLGSNDIA